MTNTTLMRAARRDIRGRTAAAVLCFLGFLCLAALVATEVTLRLDIAVRELFRPDDVWGTIQIRVDVIVEGLRPRNAALILVSAGVFAAFRRRSWRPLAYAALIGACGSVLILASKLLLHRTDPHDDLVTVGGSFPSGHVALLLVCLGGAVLVLTEHSRWWAWLLVALVELSMALALLFQAAHWLTDVVGGVLLAVPVLLVASTWSLRRRAPTARARRGTPLR